MTDDRPKYVFAIAIATLSITSAAFLATPYLRTQARHHRQVEIRVLLDANGRNQTERDLVLNGSDAEELAHCFPHLGENLKSDVAGAWLARYSLKFISVEGKIAQVDVDLDLKYWTEGKGDWSLSPQAANAILNATRSE
jgi:hypothetical protein